MTVVVSFIARADMGSAHAPGIGRARVREDLALDGTTTATAQSGEFVLIGNAESDMIAVAFGTTPDADATASTAATSAGVPIAAGLVEVVVPAAGDKINVKAL